MAAAATSVVLTLAMPVTIVMAMPRHGCHVEAARTKQARSSRANTCQGESGHVSQIKPELSHSKSSPVQRSAV
eukprot:8756301-Alexandrium_andersonii.AAC.1